MAEARDDLVRIDVAGVAHPVGETARVRMQGREGTFRVMPSPQHLVFMRRDGDDSRACLLSGEIRVTGVVCDVASFIGQSGQRGELVVIDRGAQRSIYFDGGHVVGARSSLASERLGEILCQLGVLDPLQLADCQATAASDHLRLGEAAVQHGFVTRDRLFGLVAAQTQEIFHATILVGSGAFYFLESFDEADLAARHQLSIAALVRDGVRRIHEARFFRARIPSSLHVPMALGPAPPEPELKLVHAAMDGVRSVADLGPVLGLSEFEVTRAVFQLVNGGFLTIASPRPQGAEAITDVFNRALVQIHGKCDAAGKGTELREGLARFSTGAGIYDPLFMAAGPQPDGSLKGERVAKNLAALAGDDPDAWLVQLLHEYVGFAMFQAESLLQRDVERDLVRGVADSLAPVRAVDGGPSSSHRAEPPASVRGARVPSTHPSNRPPSADSWDLALPVTPGTGDEPRGTG